MTALPFLGESRTRILGGGGAGGGEVRRVGEEGWGAGGDGFRGADFRTERMLILVFGGGMYSCVMSLSTEMGICSWNCSSGGSLAFRCGDVSRAGVGSLTEGGMAVYVNLNWAHWGSTFVGSLRTWSASRPRWTPSRAMSMGGWGCGDVDARRLRRLLLPILRVDETRVEVLEETVDEEETLRPAYSPTSATGLSLR